LLAARLAKWLAGLLLQYLPPLYPRHTTSIVMAEVRRLRLGLTSWRPCLIARKCCRAGCRRAEACVIRRRHCSYVIIYGNAYHAAVVAIRQSTVRLCNRVGVTANLQY